MNDYAHYIIRNYPQVMTQEEAKAWRTILVRLKNQHSDDLDACLHCGHDWQERP